MPDELGGTLLEHWVGQELIARAGYAGRPHRVSFWRTAYGAEVDFVWEAPREDIPIKVKWTARPRPGDARHLETFLDEFPGRARRGLLVSLRASSAAHGSGARAAMARPVSIPVVR